VAVPDTVLLPAGQHALAGVLDNDFDPAGGVLVITALSLPDDAPVSLTALDRAVLRVTEQRSLSGPVVVGYTVSNGAATAQGTVTVIPVPAPEAVAPPVVIGDEVRVRVGDVATVDVLANDSHPDNLPLELDGELAEAPDPDSEALVFVSEGKVRVHARAEPGSYHVMYRALAGTGEPATGELSILVVAADPDRNAAPAPRDLVARAVAGLAVEVKVPLDGIDPDGDRVQLQGIVEPPAQGRIVSAEAGLVVYEPGPEAAGQDEFTYLVADRLGAEAQARVLVGIAPPEGTNHPPVAAPDEVVVQPGRRVAVPVLLNDTDADGDALSLAADSVTSEDFEVRANSGRVVFTSPAEEGAYYAIYAAQDPYGAQAAGTVVVTVLDDAPLKPPIARDDEVPAAQALTGGATAEVAVLDNDEDPDGSVDAVEIGFAASSGAELLEDRRLRVPLTSQAQIIDYWLTDPDDLVGRAFIEVPGLAEARPLLDPQARPVEVTAGQSVEVPLAQHVLVGAGKTARVTEAAKVRAWNGQIEVASETMLVFTAPLGYAGPAAIYLEVTDGTGPDDPDGAKAQVAIPVTVLPEDAAANQPPVFTGSSGVRLPAGSEVAVELAPLVADPDQTDVHVFKLLSFELAGVSARLDGSTLRLVAADDAQPGATGSAQVAVNDGHNDDVASQINAIVTSSAAPLPVAVDDVVADAHQGRQVCVPVLENDINPFSSQQPLTVVAAAVESGKGAAAVGCGGVEATPGADFTGVLVVRYTIEDATKDPARHVEARARLSVLGRPSPPTAVAIEQVGNRSVVLSWQPPANNGGSPVTDYQVHAASGGSYEKSCANLTRCTLDGLSNNVAYTFTVTAANAVGASDPSAASAQARPDAVPNTPAPPTLAFGDAQLRISWTNPGSEGSAVSSYDIELSPPPPSGAARRTGLTGTSTTWTGLENGVPYMARVCARNQAPGVCDEPGHWSAYSATEVPAGVPGAPAAPTVERLEPVGSQAQVNVCWSTPAANGDPISAYNLTGAGGNAIDLQAPVSAGCQAVAVATSTTDYTFTVRAKNKAGWGAFSSPSAPLRAVTPPGQVTNLTCQSDQDGAVPLSFNHAPGNGAATSELSYTWTASNGYSGTLSSNAGAISLANTGGPYTITVTAVSTVQGAVQTSAESASVSGCQPSGTPNKPGVAAAASGSNQVRLSWSASAANGRPVSRIEISVDGGAWENVGAAAGSRTVGSGYSQWHSIKARAVDSLGRTSAVAEAGANSPAAPRAWVTRTAWDSFRIEVSNFPAGTYSKITMLYGNGTEFDCIHNSGEHYGNPCKSFNIPANGVVSNVGGMGTMNSSYAPAWFWVHIEGWGDSEGMTWEKW
jgi:hypothetical protein